MHYDRPLKQIIAEEALKDLREPFTREDMIAWIQERYPLFRDNTIRLHIVGMSSNDPNKRHRGSSRSRWRDQIFKLGPNLYRRYSPETDPPPLSVDGDDNEDEEEERDEDDTPHDQMGFVLERHLEEFMESNWAQINFGSDLRMYDDGAGTPARQFPTSVGLIDFLCEDRTAGDLVVVELKKGRPSDKVLGQCQRYMGWVQENLAKPGQTVRGLIVAPDQDERLKYARKVAPNVGVLCYRVDFQLFDPSKEPPA